MDLKNRLVAIVRVVVPVLLLGWIVHQVRQEIEEDPDRRREFFELLEPRNLPGFALAVIPYLAAIIVTFWRWYLLVCAINLPFRFRDALRLGFIGFFLQFLTLGSVGGDLFKAIFLAREQPERRPEAIATVFIDRAVGLFGLLLLTSAAFFLLGWERLPDQLHVVAITCFLVTAFACFLVAGLLWTNATTRPLRNLLRRFPPICAALMRGEHALRLYREHRRIFLVAVLSAMLSHCLLASSAYLAACVTTDRPPTYGEQIVMWNISGAIGTLPLTPGGLGTFELAYSYLYEIVPLANGSPHHGKLVAILLRVISVIVAGIGVVVYWICRREMRQLLRQAEETESVDEIAEAERGP